MSLAFFSFLSDVLFREEMETHYQKKEIEKYLKSESPLDYAREMSFEDKENLFKEIYSDISLFEQLVYRAQNDK